MAVYWIRITIINFLRLDGKLEAAKIRANLKEKVDEIRKQNPDFKPGLAIVQEIIFILEKYTISYK